MRLTPAMRDVANARQFHEMDRKLARKLRAFRPAPLTAMTDGQLVHFIGLAREAALSFGLTDSTLIERWIWVDALLAPGFYALEDVRRHFQTASGNPNVKAEDVFQLMKLNFRYAGRGSEIWWS